MEDKKEGYVQVFLKRSAIDAFFEEIFYEKYENLKFSYLFKTQAYVLYKNNLFHDFEYRLAVSNIAKGLKS